MLLPLPQLHLFYPLYPRRMETGDGGQLLLRNSYLKHLVPLQLAVVLGLALLEYK